MREKENIRYFIYSVIFCFICKIFSKKQKKTRYYLNLELSSASRPFLYIVMFIQLDCGMVFGEKQENNAAINPSAGTFGVIYWTQMKKANPFRLAETEKW